MTGLALAALSASLGLSVQSGAKQWRVDTDRQWGSWPQAGSQWTVMASSGSYRLRLQAFSGLDEAAAQRKRELQLSRIRMLYVGDIGYPGMITRELRVPAELSPKTVDGVTLLPASASLTYGVGAPDLVAYRAALTFVYCPDSRRLFQVEWFVAKAAYDEKAALAAADGFSCVR